MQFCLNCLRMARAQSSPQEEAQQIQSEGIVTTESMNESDPSKASSFWKSASLCLTLSPQEKKESL